MKTSKTILIIEDESVLRDAYKLILSHAGYKILTAENGKAALKVLDKHQPDLILLDLLMPVMDGKAFLLAARIKTKHPGIKVIIYSNLSDQKTVSEVIELGADKHVLKSSMSPSDLVEQVGAFISIDKTKSTAELAPWQP